MTMLPYMSPDQGHRIRKGGARFAIPRRASHAGGSLFDQQMRSQRDDRLQAATGPVSCGQWHDHATGAAFPSRRWCSCVLTRHCPWSSDGQTRAASARGYDRDASTARPGGSTSFLGARNQHPADRDRRRARVVPHGGVRGDRYLPGPFAIPTAPRATWSRGSWPPPTRPPASADAGLLSRGRPVVSG